MTPPYRATEDRLPLPRHQILHYLRTSLESSHRDILSRYSTTYPLEPRFGQVDPLPVIEIGQANDCYNKTTPFYLCATRSNVPLPLLGVALHNWLYHKWLRPYRNDIEYGQFIGKILIPRKIPEGTPTRQLVDEVVSIHQLICDKVQKIRQSIIDLDVKEPDNQEPQVMAILGWESGEELRQHQQHFLINPVFRAVTIIIYSNEYNDQVSDLSQIPVWVVRTGLEDGLSSPVDLKTMDQTTDIFHDDTTGQIKAICTTLETAVNFLQALERRESAVFGVKPEPIHPGEDFRSGYLPAAYNLLKDAKPLGWNDEALKGPSSQWVDTEIYTEWTGSGAHYDTVLKVREEHLRKSIRRWREIREAEARGETIDQSKGIVIE